MKNVFRLLFVMALCSIISSCSSDDDSKTVEIIPQTTFTVNGVEYKTTVEETLLQKGNMCTIVASNATEEKLKLWLDIDNYYPLWVYNIENIVGEELRIKNENNERRISINFDNDKDFKETLCRFNSGKMICSGCTDFSVTISFENFSFTRTELNHDNKKTYTNYTINGKITIRREVYVA